MIIVPRQAPDKHRENSNQLKKETPFEQAAAAADGVATGPATVANLCLFSGHDSTLMPMMMSLLPSWGGLDVRKKKNHAPFVCYSFEDYETRGHLPRQARIKNSLEGKVRR
jgi:hypothetical protein